MKLDKPSPKSYMAINSYPFTQSCYAFLVLNRRVPIYIQKGSKKCPAGAGKSNETLHRFIASPCFQTCLHVISNMK